MTFVGVPVKGFSGAKARLASVLDPASRRALGRAVADRTLRLLDAAGGVRRVVVVTGAPEVVDWARSGGRAVIAEEPGGLDGAAAAVVRAAGVHRWAVIHADLPLLTACDLEVVLAAAERHGTVLAPSSDGGTSFVSGTGRFPFAYGVASFHRHLRAAPDAAVVVRRGLAVDLDTPDDLAAAGAF